MAYKAPSLSGKIALVTGASRGAGRGIALALGSAGATVYVTGRSRPGATTEDLGGTAEETAREVTERGGRGIARLCDHTDDGQVEALFEQIRSGSGRLDLLVNNVWGGYEKLPTGLNYDPFWKQPLTHWDGMFRAGLRAHFSASRLAAPLMLEQKSGLIVNTIAWDRGKYLLHLYYDVAKHSIVRMAYGMALELKPYGIAALALAPGWIRSERVMEAHALHAFDLSGTESPEYVGRAVVALAADPDILTKSGGIFTAGGLAAEYGFTDTDGSAPRPFEMPPNMAKD